MREVRIRQRVRKSPQNKTPSEYVKIEDVADHLSLSKDGVKKLMRKRVIPFHKLGHRTVRLKLREVEEAVERYRVDAIGDSV